MGFHRTVTDVFDDFRPTILKQGAVNLQVHSILDAKLAVMLPTFSLTTDKGTNPSLPRPTKLILLNQGKEVDCVTRREMSHFYDFVQQNTYVDYRRVKTNQWWRKIYDVKEVQFPCRDSKTGSVSVKRLDGTYCHRCGVQLPLRTLTIDHQKPQDGGGMEAMLRVFRAAGLTDSAGSGEKNKYLQGEFASKIGGQTHVLEQGKRGTEQSRYSLSMKGAIFFTVLQHYKLTEQMKEMSLNHIANLRPMCGPCNSGVGNRNLTFCGD
jgi:hypothetical protein